MASGLDDASFCCCCCCRLHYKTSVPYNTVEAYNTRYRRRCCTPHYYLFFYFFFLLLVSLRPVPVHLPLQPQSRHNRNCTHGRDTINSLSSPPQQYNPFFVFVPAALVLVLLSSSPCNPFRANHGCIIRHIDPYRTAIEHTAMVVAVIIDRGER